LLAGADFGRAAAARDAGGGVMPGCSEGGGAAQVEVSEVVLGLVRAGGGHGNLDPAHALANLGADFQEPEPDGAAGGIGQLRVAQADAAQRREQNIGERRESQPELVGAQGRRRRAIGEQVELLLLDPVLDVAAGAVDVLVHGARVDRGGRQ
jgi:hypothetical protein